MICSNGNGKCYLFYEQLNIYCFSAFRVCRTFIVLCVPFDGRGADWEENGASSEWMNEWMNENRAEFPLISMIFSSFFRLWIFFRGNDDVVRKHNWLLGAIICHTFIILNVLSLDLYTSRCATSVFVYLEYYYYVEYHGKQKVAGWIQYWPLLAHSLGVVIGRCDDVKMWRLEDVLYENVKRRLHVHLGHLFIRSLIWATWQIIFWCYFRQ